MNNSIIANTDHIISIIVVITLVNKSAVSYKFNQTF